MADVKRCFRRRWEEDRGDRFSSWGHATYDAVVAPLKPFNR